MSHSRAWARAARAYERSRCGGAAARECVADPTDRALVNVSNLGVWNKQKFNGWGLSPICSRARFRTAHRHPFPHSAISRSYPPDLLPLRATQPTVGGISDGLLTPEQEAHLAARKASLRGANMAYFAAHPEFRALMTDFLETCVQQEPEELTEFAAAYFCDVAARREAIAERT